MYIVTLYTTYFNIAIPEKLIKIGISVYKFTEIKNMTISTVTPPALSNYSLNVLQDEARHLVERGTVSRHQPIYVLCQHIPPREWVVLESELERRDYLLRDRIGDLIGYETWDND